jgi:S-adenosylmethionine:tRNA ribosyltransferase-isomerase
MPVLEQYGEIPLPPYIVQRRKELDDADTAEDLERYQTVYAREHGSVAAPTAGLHFTPALLESIRSRGVQLAWVTLHVGAGTFKPVEVENPSEHPMHMEFYEVPIQTAELIAKTHANGHRVIAVGTTTVRTLESAYDKATGSFTTGRQSTRLLILPGYKFGVIDGLVTNFHLPRSSLMMMVSALAGHEHIMAAYREAIIQKYRFYSYGDAMLIN